MTRRNIAIITTLALTVSLALAAGCKKAKKTGGSSSGGTTDPMGMKTPPMADMDPTDAMDMTPAMTPARPALTPGKGRAGAMPIPYNYMVVHANLKAVRGSSLYKKYEPKLKAMLAKAMTERKAIADIVKKCKVDILGGVDQVMLGHGMDNQDAEATVIIATGGFDTGKLMACVKPELKKAKVEFKEVEVAGKKGVEVTYKGKSATVIALSDKSMAMIGKPVLAKANEVLSGKLQSVEDTALYKDAMKKAKPSTVLIVLVPTIPASLTSRVQFPVVKKLRTVVAMIGLPGDGLEANVGADFGDAKTASTLARTLPALMGFAKAKLGALGAKLLKNLKVKAEGSWVRVSVTADKETFAKLQDMLMKLMQTMGSTMSGKPKAAEPAMKAAPMKAKKAK